ncbi:MAG TPA: secretin N-terminal domain-containing protein [Verrucomicrobiae bacterium]|jgi:type II secretory pathway component GspD/PulD (secretin)
MKKSILTLVAMGFAALLFSAAAQTPPVSQDDNNTNAASDQSASPPEMDNGSAPDAGNATPDTGDATPDMGGGQQPDQSAPAENSSAPPAAILPTQAIGVGNETVQPSFAPPDAAGTNSDAILLNFANAPLDEVLSYLSDAAGFIIVLDTPVSGRVSVISKHPMTKDEAVDLLNSVLNQNGYAAIRDGRTLTIMNKTDAMKSDIPVKVGSVPDTIPKNDEIVTQVIPIRFVDAGDLVKDMSSFVSPQATVVANDAGNSIIITDTQSNIRHLAEIIKAIDDSAEAETEIQVFRLKYASPTDVANELSSVFPSGSGSGNNNTQAPIRFGGGGFGGGGGRFAALFGGGRGGGGGGAQAGDNSSNDRIKKATQVTAVADSRIQAVIVTAPKDMMAEIAEMMKDLDVPSTRDQNVYVFHVNNADPYQALTVLQNMFQTTSSSRGGGSSSAMTQSPLQLREQNTATTTSQSSTATSSSFTGGGAARGGGGGGGGF